MTQLPISAEHYSDIIDAGGLVAAVQQSLIRNGSPLTVSGVAESTFPTYARVEFCNRFSQVYAAVHERLFLFDIWHNGVMYGGGKTTDIDELAITMNRWVHLCYSVSDMAQSLCIQLAETAKAFDEGHEVEARWNSFLTGEYRNDEYSDFICLASQQPALRMLFPYTSLYTVCFSRCTGYPYSRDCPHVTPLGQGQFQVGARDFDNLGVGNAAFAVNVVLEHLPRNCGPAIKGTAKDLKET